MACCLFPYVNHPIAPSDCARVCHAGEWRIVAADFDVAKFVRYVENLAVSDFRHEPPRNDRAVRQRPNMPAERRLYFLILVFLKHDDGVNLRKRTLQWGPQNLGKEREFF